MIWLRQSTSVVISLGPFVLNSDGVTLVTNLVGTGANQTENTSTGIRIAKNGGAFAARHATAVASTYDAFGNYLVTLDTTDTGTLGALRIQFANGAAFCPVWMDFMIVPANVWDSMFGATLLQVDLTQVKTGAVPNPNVTGVPLVDAKYLLGTVFPTPTVAGVPNVNVKTINDVSTSPVTTIKAVQGLTTADTIATYTGNTPQTGDSYARLGAPIGASISADVAGVQSDTDDIQTRIPTSLVSGRMDSSVGAMAVDVVTASAIAADAIGSAELATTAVNEIRDAILSDSTPFQGVRIDAAISSRSSHAAADVWTSGTRTLSSFGTLVADVVTAVWAATTRTLSAFGFSVTVATNNDKTGYALTSAYDPAKTAAQAGDAMTLTTGERTAVANEVEAQIIDETDSEKVLTAITDKIASVNPSLGSLTLAAIATQVRTELTTELTRIDAAISSRSTYAGGDTSGVTTLLARLTAIRAGLLDNLDAAVSSRGTGTALDAAGVRSAVGMASANLDTQIDALPTNTELATALASADDAVLAAIAALNNLSQANVRTALGLGAANLDTQLSTIAGYIDNEVAGIKVVVDKLNTALELEGSTYRFTVDALAQAPVADCATVVEIRQEIDTNSTQLQAIRNKTDDISPGSITVMSPVTLSGGLITIIQGTTVDFDDLKGLGSLTGRSKLYFTVKRSLDDSDDQAIIQIEEMGGLIKLNGADAANDEDASITVDDESAGDITIEIKPRASSVLPVTTSDSNAIYYYDVKKIAVDDTRPLVNGRFKVTAIVTDAIE